MTAAPVYSSVLRPPANSGLTFEIVHQRSIVDPNDRDATWVCLVGPKTDDLVTPEAKELAIRYVQEKRRGGPGCGYDQASGPFPDDGHVGPPGLASGSHMPAGPDGSISADAYLQMAAVQQMGQAAGKADRYVYFIRVRRNG